MCKIARSERECTIQWQYIIFFLNATYTHTHLQAISYVIFKISFECTYLFLSWLNDFESAFFGISFKHFYELCSIFFFKLLDMLFLTNLYQWHMRNVIYFTSLLLRPKKNFCENIFHNFQFLSMLVLFCFTFSVLNLIETSSLF